MDGYLRQGTSATIVLGPYVSSDGVALIGLTITQSEVMLAKNGAAFVAKNNSTSASHQSIGFYSAMLDDTDTGSLGRLKIMSSGTAALLVWHDFTVLPSSVFDSLIIGTDLLQIDMRQIDGQQTNASSAGFTNAVADTMLTRDWTLVSGEAQRSALNAFRTLRNRVTTSGFITTYKEDNVTAAWTGSLAFDINAQPIVDMTPAS